MTSRPLRLLLTTQAPTRDAQVCAALREAGLELGWRRVDSVMAFSLAVGTESADVVVADDLNRALPAEEVIRLAELQDRGLPVVVLLDHADVARAVALMRAGAKDCVAPDELGKLAVIVEREVRARVDLRQHRGAQAEARRLAAIVSDAHYAVMSQSLDGLFLTFNAGAERLFGYLAEEMVGRPMAVLLPDGMEPQLVEIRRRVAAGEFIPPFDTVRVHKSGRLIDVSVSISPVRDERGAVCGISAIAVDITARKAAERENLLLRSIVDASPDVIGVTGFDGQPHYLNPAGRALLGIGADQPLTAASISGGLDSRNERAFAERILPELATGETLSGEVVVPHHGTGLPTPLEWRAFPVAPAAGGPPTMFAGVARDVSERTRAEAKLAESERRHRELVASIPQTVWMASPDGMVDYLNAHGERRFGALSRNPQRADFRALIHPDDRERTRLAWVAAATSGQGFTVENRLREPDGTYRWALCEAVQLPGADGERARWLGTVVDIDERKRAELELRHTTELLTAVTDGTPDAVYVKDASGRYMLCNPAAAGFLGAPRDKVPGQRDEAFFDPIEAADIERRDLLVMASAQTITVEETLTIRGSRRTFLTTKGPYRNEDGLIDGVIGVSRDITDRKVAEDALRLRDRAIRAASQGFIITDPSLPDNHISYTSPSVERVTGYSPAEIVGRNCRFLQGPDTDPATVTQMRRAIERGEPCTVEILNYRKDGRPFYNELSISPVRDDGGRVTHFVGVQSDVTQRRQLEEQFRQAQKMEAIGLLAGGVAHDFNNLLTVINGYTDMLLRMLPEPDPARELVEEIERAGALSAGLTRQLLTFSRKSAIAPRTLSINDVVTETERMLRRLVREDVTLHTSLAPDLGPVVADPGHVEQVLINLVVNARDAMPEGGSLWVETLNRELDEAYVALHPEARPGPHVVLRVRDDGTGMTPEVRQRLFEPFFTTKDHGHGTGLGLATVYGIVQQAGGHILVESEVGVGTMFEVTLPRATPQGAEQDGAAVTQEPKSGGETILVVEDEAAVRLLVRRILTRAGYTVVAATDGEDALRQAMEHQGPLHLLLTDVVMPGLGGRAVADRVGELRPGIKVIYMSGYVDDAVVRAGVLLEGVNFLQKPFTLEGLTTKVREVLDA